ncbi:MAG TPA: preprotein translocase subunit SecE [Verrucomicrobiae bacterium]|nr:preprotein translocase subunit SecE [Verrucomicrobiae bacterium]
MANPFFKVRDFLTEVSIELKKSSWPTRKELVDSTIVVMITIVVLGLFVALADIVFLRIIGFLTRAA